MIKSKKMNKLIPAMALLVMSAIMMISTSYAWFSMNTSVSVTGMKVQATATDSLVVNDNFAQLAAKTSVTFDAAAKTLSPITYGTPTDGATDTYIYCNNAENVDPNTGLKGKDDLTFAEVGSVGGQTADVSYSDYIVYLSSTEGTLTGKAINATVTFDTPSLTQLAVTVDFWVGSAVASAVTSEGVATPFTGAELKGSIAAADAVKTASVIDSTVTLPAYNADGNKAIPVLMRVYFDGALEDAGTAGSTYVRNSSKNLDPLSFSVVFSIAD